MGGRGPKVATPASIEPSMVRVILLTIALLCAPAIASAQVALCETEALPAPLAGAIRLELATRGQRVELRCDGDRVAGLRVDDPLGPVWVWVRRAGHERTARLQGALDTIDPRVVALALASLLEPEERAPVDVEAIAPEPRERDEPARQVSAPPPSAPLAPPIAPAPAPRARRRSSRSFDQHGSVGVSAYAAAIGFEAAGAGGGIDLAAYVAPAFRLQLTSFCVGAERVWEWGIGVGGAGLLEIAPDTTWIELGIEFAAGLRSRANLVDGLLGVAVVAGLLQRLTADFAWSVRLRGAPLYSLSRDAAEASLAISTGIVWTF